ncbi:response regulator transcription factor [Aestuariibacter halophilus]|uniref:Response regulator transcription factor n=1 Tax=Fluctibacter halophilus TaxID=226011 RepID=A0ABS8G4N6_9ALTE|nr:response regulator transcription factor [Aestuariibacter halophilus]MCC2615552.1 response regulator transcription factor [Aestuariibacter halophilus]
MARFLIADDHPLFREALIGALTPHFEPASFVESDSLATTLAALDNDSIDVILLDLNMPGCENYYGVIRVHQEHPAIPIIVVSASESNEVISYVMGLGACGFVPKSTPTATIAEAVRLVMSGEQWLPPERADDIQDVGAEQRSIAEKVAQLTPKQFKVLKLLQAGLLNKQIAGELFVTEATVKAHISAIFKKLDVNTRTQAVLLVEKLQHEL